MCSSSDDITHTLRAKARTARRVDRPKADLWRVFSNIRRRVSGMNRHQVPHLRGRLLAAATLRLSRQPGPHTGSFPGNSQAEDHRTKQDHAPARLEGRGQMLRQTSSKEPLPKGRVEAGAARVACTACTHGTASGRLKGLEWRCVLCGPMETRRFSDTRAA